MSLTVGPSHNSGFSKSRPYWVETQKMPHRAGRRCAYDRAQRHTLGRCPPAAAPASAMTSSSPRAKAFCGGPKYLPATSRRKCRSPICATSSLFFSIIASIGSPRGSFSKRGFQLAESRRQLAGQRLVGDLPSPAWRAPTWPCGAGLRLGGVARAGVDDPIPTCWLQSRPSRASPKGARHPVAHRESEIITPPPPFPAGGRTCRAS